MYTVVLFCFIQLKIFYFFWVLCFIFKKSGFRDPCFGVSFTDVKMLNFFWRHLSIKRSRKGKHVYRIGPMFMLQNRCRATSIDRKSLWLMITPDWFMIHSHNNIIRFVFTSHSKQSISTAMTIIRIIIIEPIAYGLYSIISFSTENIYFYPKNVEGYNFD